MRLLFLTHSFNSLTQRLWCELTALGHEVSIEFDINDRVAEEAVALWKPDLILAPYLRRAIPESIWRTHVCLVVHPGIPGDRGASALDWAIQNGETDWGVTLLQAEAEMDAGPIWATRSFYLRPAAKASIYRNEVTDAAVACVREALGHWEAFCAKRWKPTPLAAWRDDTGAPARGVWRERMTQDDRAIDWAGDDTKTVLRKIRAADGFPGVRTALHGAGVALDGLACHVFDAHAETTALDAALLAQPPGTVLAQRHQALLVRTRDGALWIGHAKRLDAGAFKLPAAMALPELTSSLAPWPPEAGSGQDIRYAEVVDMVGEGINERKITTGVLRFDFYNGAMSAAQCERLRAAIEYARTRPVQVLLLLGGEDFWSNGLHLNLIEADASPADASWANINAIDDVCAALLACEDKLVISALQGNAGAGGVFFALAADEVWAREGVILNPHYKNMGNLYGSEYWSYVLPRKLGAEGAAIMRERLPLDAARAEALGLVDRLIGGDTEAFRAEAIDQARLLAAHPALPVRIARKARARRADEATKPLAAYRAEELAEMRRNFYGFDPSYHVARHHFVHKTPHSWTPRHLALHRTDHPEERVA